MYDCHLILYQDELRQTKEEEMDDYCSQVFTIWGIAIFSSFISVVLISKWDWFAVSYVPPAKGFRYA